LKHDDRSIHPTDEEIQRQKNDNSGQQMQSGGHNVITKDKNCAKIENKMLNIITNRWIY